MAGMESRASMAVRSSRGTPRVLVVDDDLDMVTTLATLLELWGYEVRAALDGEATLSTAATFRPDAVILDIAMPRMNGFELTRRLRRAGPRGLTVICLSGYGSEADRERSREAGCDHHLIKPADPEEIRRLLGPPGPARRGLPDRHSRVGRAVVESAGTIA